MNKKWICLILTMICLGVFLLYLKWDMDATDTVAPVIRIDETPVVVSVTAPETALLQGIRATDDRDGDVTGSVLIESITRSGEDGRAVVVYAAFDRAGNVTKAEREIRYSDYVGPRFDLKQALVFTENTGFDVLGVVTAEDHLDGDITHRIRATTLDGSSVSGVGSHLVQFRVSNSLGDTAVLELPVEVYPAGSFHGTLQLRDYVVYLKVGEPFDETDYPLSFTLGSKTVEFERKLPEQYSMQIENRVDTENPGVYEVCYTLTYHENGYSYDGYSKLFVVVEG